MSIFPRGCNFDSKGGRRKRRSSENREEQRGMMVLWGGQVDIV